MLQNEPHGSQAWPSALSIDLGLAVFQNSNKLDRLIRRPNGTGGGGMHRWTDRRGSGKFTWTGPCIRRRLLAGFLAGSPSSRLRQIGSDAIPSGLAVEEEEGENVVGREARAPAAGGWLVQPPAVGSEIAWVSLGPNSIFLGLLWPTMRCGPQRGEVRSLACCRRCGVSPPHRPEATAQPGEVAARPPPDREDEAAGQQSSLRVRAAGPPRRRGVAGTRPLRLLGRLPRRRRSCCLR